ncbi:MAG: DUF2339 domain-containing protein [Longimicrobiales bacterium]|nr:DUF2339 domain-containing protein [Longimicrobiales bacterium]
MFGPPPDGLEARVARLERLLNRVLVLLQDVQPGAIVQPEMATEENRREERSQELLRPGVEDELPEKPEGFGSQKKAGAPRGGAKDSKVGLGFLADSGILAPGGTFLSRVGIGLLLLSVAFFFKYSIDQGWLTEWVRLAIGVMAGIILVILGFKGASKGEPLGTALAGGGIATFFITGFVGHQWYELVSYPMAFGFLVAVSGLGIFLALRSGLQALAMVGLIGALATPLLLTAPRPDVVGFALYVSLIVASVAAIYMARAWRALLLMAVVTAWLVLSIAVGQATGLTANSVWVVQGGIAFIALVFWLVPLFRAVLRAQDPGRWPRPEGAQGPWSAYAPWDAHLDALSLLMPVVGVMFSAWLWELSRPQLGWAFLGTALLALGVGGSISRTRDPEDSASTQWFVAILLSTVGMGLVLTGDILYLAFIAEAVALLTLGSRKRSPALLGLGGVVEVVVAGLFLFRLAFGGTLLEGDLSSVFDLAAIGGAVVIGTQLTNPDGRRGFFIGAYLAFLAFTARELNDHQSLRYLAFVLTVVVTQVVAVSRRNSLLSALGHVPAIVVLSLFWSRLDAAHSLWAGDLTSLVDLAALGAVAYVGTLLRGRDGWQLYLFGAYLGLLAWTAKELYPVEQGQALMSLAFGVEGTVLLVAGLLTGRAILQQVGMGTLLLVVVKVLLVDLAAVEPIWRVLLLFLFAVLFLVLSKFVQDRRRLRSDAPEPGERERTDSDLEEV